MVRRPNQTIISGKAKINCCLMENKYLLCTFDTEKSSCMKKVISISITIPPPWGGKKNKKKRKGKSSIYNILINLVKDLGVLLEEKSNLKSLR